MVARCSRLAIAAAVALVMVCGSAQSAHAWMRIHYDDAIVVKRSPLIVVGHLEWQSIVLQPHPPARLSGNSWEHYATLVITRELKGHAPSVRLPIIIHYGLTPVVGGRAGAFGLFTINLRGSRKHYPPHRIEIVDSGNMSLNPIVGDAGKDNLWFLRQRSGRYGNKPGHGMYGVVDPEDVQPLLLESYFAAYLSPQPEAAVRRYVHTHPSVAARAQPYFDHQALLRVQRIRSPRLRLHRLLPLYRRRLFWAGRNKAREALLSTGVAGAAALLKHFNDPKYAHLRSDIMMIWRKLAYRPAALTLIAVLRRHDQFWAKQTLRHGWWNRRPSSTLTRRRRHIYSETYAAVSALHAMRDPRARAILQRVLRRWRTINFSNPQIVQECTAALAALPASP